MKRGKRLETLDSEVHFLGNTTKYSKEGLHYHTIIYVFILIKLDIPEYSFAQLYTTKKPVKLKNVILKHNIRILVTLES